ncbi:unnamed protein product, partial [Mesorhabditis belari]|uniref:Uncharacterized protein n=1 Tax=Mesorhabditis belari TaxID=2138241 RepID=A0AAF3JBY5_9BILA
MTEVLRSPELYRKLLKEKGLSEVKGEYFDEIPRMKPGKCKEVDEDSKSHQTATMLFGDESDDEDGYATPSEMSAVDKWKHDETAEAATSESDAEPAETSRCETKSNLDGWESDLSVTRSFTALPRRESRGETSQREAELIEENRRLKTQLELISRGDSSLKDILEENEKLKKQLDEANDYVDHVDIENEQQYSTMSNQIEELIQMVQEKKKENLNLKKNVEDRDRTIAQLSRNVDQHKVSIDRQHEIIEQIREELDREKDLRIEADNEKDKLYGELGELQKRVDDTRNEFVQKEMMLQMELEDVQRILDKQKEILSASSVASLVDKWERRVLSLENAVREREIMLHTQQQIIAELRRRMAFLDRGAASSGESLDSSERSAIEHRKKQAVFRYLTSDDYEKKELVGSVAVALDLTKDEEDHLRNTLNRTKKHRKQYIL